jgi:serine/threonine protein kinase
VSPEGRDLAAKMLAKDPAERVTAKKALAHNWFTLEHTSNATLSDACENMKKYRDENRFNVQKIKPEFSMITCSPFICCSSKGVISRESSPLILGSAAGVKAAGGRARASSNNVAGYTSNSPFISTMIGTNSPFLGIIGSEDRKTVSFWWFFDIGLQQHKNRVFEMPDCLGRCNL